MKADCQRSSLRELSALGQSVWLDGLSRPLLRSGKLKRLIESDGLSGASFNFRVLEDAVATSADYDRAIAATAGSRTCAESIYQRLAIQDAQAAADLLRPVYDGTDGRDGFVSVELSPHFAHDTVRTVEAARQLWDRLNRRNVLIKIPGTAAGVGAIRALIDEGINVNATLIFGSFRYVHVANAYIAGLMSRSARGLPIDRVASVASLSLSCVDSLLDPRLQAMAGRGSDKAAALVGRVAITAARLIYARYRELFDCNHAFAELAQNGARLQTLMWTCTASENPAYPATKYIDPLIGPGAFTELSLASIDTYREAGRPDLRLAAHPAEAAFTMACLAGLGLDLREAELQLEAKELDKRKASYDRLMASIAGKVEAASAARRAPRGARPIPDSSTVATTS